MTFASRAALVAALIAATLSLSACVPLVVAGAAGTAMVVTDRRSAGAQFDDVTIEGKIMTEATTRFGDRGHVNVTSFNGTVLLSGEVPDEAGKASIGTFARGVERVRAVENELVVARPSELSARSNDGYLTSLVKSRFVEGTDLFAAGHVKVVTEREVVYLMGIVTRSEADAAGRIAASTKGVKRVVKIFEYID